MEDEIFSPSSSSSNETLDVFPLSQKSQKIRERTIQTVGGGLNKFLPTSTKPFLQKHPIRSAIIWRRSL